MALVRIDHVPETVKVNLPLNIILPGQMGESPFRGAKCCTCCTALAMMPAPGSALPPSKPWQRSLAQSPLHRS